MYSPRFLFALLALSAVAVLSNYDVAAPDSGEIDEFFASGLTVGYDLDNRLFCEPETKERSPQLAREYVLQEIGKQKPNQSYHLISLPEGFASEHFIDAPGDTVMVLSSGGSFRTVIDGILYLESGCNQEFVCSLKLIDGVPARPERLGDFIALRKGKFYDGPVIPYAEYQIDDSSYLAAADSLRDVLTRTWLAEDSSRFEENLSRMRANEKEDFIASWKRRTSDKSYPFYKIVFGNYGVKSESAPDTMFLFVAGYSTYATEFSWCALFDMRKINGVWQPGDISPPHKGSHKFQFRFAFDLNGDGSLEYLINNSIFTLVDGQLSPVLPGRYRGC